MTNSTTDNAERSQGDHFGDLAAADLQSPYGDETGGQGRVGEWIRAAAINRPRFVWVPACVDYSCTERAAHCMRGAHEDTTTSIKRATWS